MTVPKHINHAEEAEEKTPYIYKGDTVFVAVRDAIMEAVQEADDDAIEFMAATFIDSAFGASLDDIWGVVLNEPRLALDDGDYRRVLKVVVGAIHSQSVAETAISVVRGLSESPEMYYNETHPLTMMIYFVSPVALSDSMRERMRNLIQRAKPVTVKAYLIEAPAGYFGFAGNPNALGYDTGKFARLVH